MDASKPNAHDWHRWPKNQTGPCPVCGLPQAGFQRAGKQYGEHRAVSPDENLAAKWMHRIKSASGWKYHSIVPGSPIKRPGAPGPTVAPATSTGPDAADTAPTIPAKRERPRTQITAQVRHCIRMATKMAALGKSNEEISQALHRSTRAVELWKQDYPELWQDDFRAAMNEVLSKVQEAAKGKPISKDQDAERAAVDALAGQAAIARTAKLPNKPNPGEPLSLWTLLELYEQHHPDSKGGTHYQMGVTLRMFERWAGRVLMVSDLTDGFLLRFLGEYLATGVSPATVNSKRCQLLALWRFARKHRLCKRGPHDVPRMKGKPALPEAWTLEEVQRILAVAQSLPGPIGKGVSIPAAAWWFSLFMVCYDTGQRIGAIMQLKPRDVDLDHAWIVFPANIEKTGRPKFCRIYPETVEACRAIWSNDREVMWPWPTTREMRERTVRKLFLRAGVAYGHKRGGLFHKFRRTSGTLVEAAGGDGARHLGNTRAVFEQHYKDPRVAGTDAAMLLPRPNMLPRPGPDQKNTNPLEASQ